MYPKMRLQLTSDQVWYLFPEAKYDFSNVPIDDDMPLSDPYIDGAEYLDS
jgi:hypothetical protein